MQISIEQGNFDCELLPKKDSAILELHCKDLNKTAPIATVWQADTLDWQWTYQLKKGNSYCNDILYSTRERAAEWALRAYLETRKSWVHKFIHGE